MHEYFSKIEDKYAYSELNLHLETATQCNFNVIGGKMTGRYWFQTGFYGLFDMLAEFQRAIEYT